MTDYDVKITEIENTKHYQYSQKLIYTHFHDNE